jgi:PAS domain S-box-containing protein
MAERNTIDAGTEEQLFRLLVENAVDYCIFTTDPTGHILTWNPGAERMLGYSEAEVRGRNCDLIFVAEDRRAGGPELERELAQRVGRAENERWHLRKDGSRFWGAGIMIALRDDTGAHVGFAKILRDFTRRREIQKALLQQERMESVGVLVGGIAHLFNNLHTALLGNAELLSRRPSLRQDPGAMELLGEMRRASERTTEITRHLLQYTGKGFAQMHPLDLCRELDTVPTRLELELPPRVRLSINVPDGCPPVIGEPTLLRQLVTQLVLNAAEAIGQAGGSIVVSARPEVLTPESVAGPEYAAFELRPGRYVMVEVRDTGPGMDSATQSRIFEPFFTTRFPGRGLGLASALGIVRTHGGAIRVSSEPGSGTSVRVLLPSAPAPRGAEEPEPHAGDTHAESARPLVLVCDDEELVRNLAVAALESEGMTVVQVENGDQALKTVDRLQDALSVVLLDLAMPIMDGEQTLPLLRQRRPEVPIVMMTGMGDLDARERLAQLGADSFLVKPFTLERLVSAVQDVLAPARD